MAGSDDLVLFVNDGGAEILGAKPADLVGRTIADVLPDLDDDGEGLRLVVNPALPAQRVLEGHAYRAPDRSERRVLVFQEVTRRAQKLSALARNEARFARIAEATLDMVTETSQDGLFTYASRACATVLGYAPEDLVSTSPLDLHHPDDLPRFLKEMSATRGSTKPFHVTPHRLRHKQGHFVPVEATGVRYRMPDGEERVIGVARDITGRLGAERARDELQERMLRAQKLESLGVLAAGIAHDFNNLLTPIVGNAGLLLSDLPEDSPNRRWAEAIRDAGHRATALTTQMLTYAGQTERRVGTLDLSEVIEDVSLLLETTASSASRLALDLGRGLPPVHGSAGQITQIVMNLVANASEALGDDGGRIEVATRLVRADRSLLDRCYLGERRPEGEYVEIAVSDDGEGLPADLLEQIFDPFFTTRVTGRGLGLAVVLGAAQAHDGAIQIESTSTGTCFRVLIPACRGETRETTANPDPEEARVDRSHGFVLVVDDDEAAREVSVTLLQRAGFEVLQASSGPQAIALFRRHASDIDGVVLDGTMPGMSGAHVFESLRAIDPEARVMLVSGHAQERVAETLLDRGLTGFLHKPYEPTDLVYAVRRLLARP